MQNDLKVIKIVQKARELADGDLLNEQLVQSLINTDFKELNAEQKAKITELLNALVESKEKAMLS